MNELDGKGQQKELAEAMKSLAMSITLLARAISQANQHGEEEEDDSPRIPKPL